MITLSLFLLALGSFAQLSLCQYGHYRKACGSALTEARSRLLRGAGLLQLSLGAALAIYVDGAYGIILYICLWVPGALGIVWLLSQAPKLLPLVAMSLVIVIMMQAATAFWPLMP